MAYYTSYLAIWKLGVPTLQIFWATLYDNVFFLALGPARFLGSPLVLSPSAFVRTASGLVFLLLTVVGVVRESSCPGGVQSITCCLSIWFLFCCGTTRIVEIVSFCHFFFCHRRHMDRGEKNDCLAAGSAV